MPAKLNYAIPYQGYEVARDQIAAILTIELESQYLDHGNYDADVDVYKERTNSFDKTELSDINVMMGPGDFSNKDANGVDGTYSFAIDAYISSPSREGMPGDVIANIRMWRVLGLCRAILDHTAYRTLGFEPGFICNVHSTGIVRLMPRTNEDARNTAMGRLTLSVRLTEDSPLIPASTLIGGVDSIVKIAETDYGYKYIISP